MAFPDFRCPECGATLPSESTGSSKDEFLEKRAKKLKLLDNGVKTCEQNHLHPTVAQLKEAVQIGFELLEECHRGNVQERLANLVKKATALVERIESKEESGDEVFSREHLQYLLDKAREQGFDITGTPEQERDDG